MMLIAFTLMKLMTAFFTVYATDVAQTTTVSSSEIITIENPALPLKVSCPIVAEPNIPYSCGFASTPGSGSLTVKYEEYGIENSTTFDPNLINAGICNVRIFRR